MAYQSVNPYDGKILKTLKELTDNQLETALGNAATCFENWRHTTFAGRVASESIGRDRSCSRRFWRTSSPARSAAEAFAIDARLHLRSRGTWLEPASRWSAGCRSDCSGTACVA